MTNTTPVDQADERARRIILATGAIVLLCGLNSGWIGPLLPAMAAAHKVSLVYAGSMVSLYAAGSIIPIFFGKILMDRLGGKLCIQVAAFLIGVGLLVIGLGANAAVMTAGAGIMGFGGGVSSVAGNVCVLQLVKGSGAAALNKLHLFFGVGALVGPLLAWAALQTPYSYHLVYAGAALFAFLISASLVPYKNFPIASQAATLKPAPLHFKSIALFCYPVIIFLYVGIETAAVAWLYTYLVNAGHLQAGLSSVAMSLLWAGMVVGRLANVYLLKRFSANALIVSAMILATSALALLALYPEMGSLALPVVALLGAGFAPIFPSVLAAANARFSRQSSTVTSIVITAGALGGMALPWATGKVLETNGLSWTMTMMAIIFSLQIALFVLAQNEKKAHADSTSANDSSPKDAPGELV